MKRFLGLLFIAAICYGCNRYEKFEKVVWDEEAETFLLQNTYSEDFKRNIINIFTFMNEDYKMMNNELYISRRLKKDIELLWNYCNKAETSEWIDERKKLFEEGMK